MFLSQELRAPPAELLRRLRDNPLGRSASPADAAALNTLRAESALLLRRLPLPEGAPGAEHDDSEVAGDLPAPSVEASLAIAFLEGIFASFKMQAAGDATAALLTAVAKKLTPLADGRRAVLAPLLSQTLARLSTSLVPLLSSPSEAVAAAATQLAVPLLRFVARRSQPLPLVLALLKAALGNYEAAGAAGAASWAGTGAFAGALGWAAVAAATTGYESEASPLAPLPAHGFQLPTAQMLEDLTAILGSLQPSRPAGSDERWRDVRRAVAWMAATLLEPLVATPVTADGSERGDALMHLAAALGNLWDVSCPATATHVRAALKLCSAALATAVGAAEAAATFASLGETDPLDLASKTALLLSQPAALAAALKAGPECVISILRTAAGFVRCTKGGGDIAPVVEVDERQDVRLPTQWRWKHGSSDVKLFDAGLAMTRVAASGAHCAVLGTQPLWRGVAVWSMSFSQAKDRLAFGVVVGTAARGAASTGQLLQRSPGAYLLNFSDAPARQHDRGLWASGALVHRAADLAWPAPGSLQSEWITVRYDTQARTLEFILDGRSLGKLERVPPGGTPVVVLGSREDSVSLIDQHGLFRLADLKPETSGTPLALAAQCAALLRAVPRLLIGVLLAGQSDASLPIMEELDPAVAALVPAATRAAPAVLQALLSELGAGLPMTGQDVERVGLLSATVAWCALDRQIQISTDVARDVQDLVDAMQSLSAVDASAALVSPRGMSLIVAAAGMLAGGAAFWGRCSAVLAPSSLFREGMDGALLERVGALDMQPRLAVAAAPRPSSPASALIPALAVAERHAYVALLHLAPARGDAWWKTAENWVPRVTASARFIADSLLRRARAMNTDPQAAAALCEQLERELACRAAFLMGARMDGDAEALIAAGTAFLLSPRPVAAAIFAHKASTLVAHSVTILIQRLLALQKTTPDARASSWEAYAVAGAAMLHFDPSVDFGACGADSRVMTDKIEACSELRFQLRFAASSHTSPAIVAPALLALQLLSARDAVDDCDHGNLLRLADALQFTALSFTPAEDTDKPFLLRLETLVCVIDAGRKVDATAPQMQSARLRRAVNCLQAVRATIRRALMGMTLLSKSRRDSGLVYNRFLVKASALMMALINLAADVLDDVPAAAWTAEHQLPAATSVSDIAADVLDAMMPRAAPQPGVELVRPCVAAAAARLLLRSATSWANGTAAVNAFELKLSLVLLKSIAATSPEAPLLFTGRHHAHLRLRCALIAATRACAVVSPAVLGLLRATLGKPMTNQADPDRIAAFAVMGGLADASLVLQPDAETKPLAPLFPALLDAASAMRGVKCSTRGNLPTDVLKWAQLARALKALRECCCVGLSDAAPDFDLLRLLRRQDKGQLMRFLVSLALYASPCSPGELHYAAAERTLTLWQDHAQGYTPSAAQVRAVTNLSALIAAGGAMDGQRRRHGPGANAASPNSQTALSAPSWDELTANAPRLLSSRKQAPIFTETISPDEVTAALIRSETAQAISHARALMLATVGTNAAGDELLPATHLTSLLRRLCLAGPQASIVAADAITRWLPSAGAGAAGALGSLLSRQLRELAAEREAARAFPSLDEVLVTAAPLSVVHPIAPFGFRRVLRRLRFPGAEWLYVNFTVRAQDAADISPAARLVFAEDTAAIFRAPFLSIETRSATPSSPSFVPECAPHEMRRWPLGDAVHERAFIVRGGSLAWLFQQTALDAGTKTPFLHYCIKVGPRRHRPSEQLPCFNLASSTPAAWPEGNRTLFTLESAHPYTANEEGCERYEALGAPACELRFNTAYASCTEVGCDFLQVIDPPPGVRAVRSGDAVSWRRPLPLGGDGAGPGITLRFRSDSSIQFFGFVAEAVALPDSGSIPADESAAENGDAGALALILVADAALVKLPPPPSVGPSDCPRRAILNALELLPLHAGLSLVARTAAAWAIIRSASPAWAAERSRELTQAVASAADEALAAIHCQRRSRRRRRARRRPFPSEYLVALAELALLLRSAACKPPVTPSSAAEPPAARRSGPRLPAMVIPAAPDDEAVRETPVLASLERCAELLRAISERTALPAWAADAFAQAKARALTPVHGAFLRGDAGWSVRTASQGRLLRRLNEEEGDAPVVDQDPRAGLWATVAAPTLTEAALAAGVGEVPGDANEGPFGDTTDTAATAILTLDGLGGVLPGSGLLVLDLEVLSGDELTIGLAVLAPATPDTDYVGGPLRAGGYHASWLWALHSWGNESGDLDEEESHSEESDSSVASDSRGTDFCNPGDRVRLELDARAMMRAPRLRVRINGRLCGPRPGLPHDARLFFAVGCGPGAAVRVAYVLFSPASAPAEGADVPRAVWQAPPAGWSSLHDVAVVEALTAMDECQRAASGALVNAPRLLAGFDPLLILSRRQQLWLLNTLLRPWLRTLGAAWCSSPPAASFAAALQRHRALLFPESIRAALLLPALVATASTTGSLAALRLSRAPGAPSLWTQAVPQLAHAAPFRAYPHDGTPSGGEARLWAAAFEGEGGTDAGGVFRESFAALAADLTAHASASQESPVSLLRPSAANPELLEPHPDATSPEALRQFTLLGALAAGAVRIATPLELRLTPATWAALAAGGELGGTSVRRQLAALRDGLWGGIPPAGGALLTPQALELACCGASEVQLPALRAATIMPSLDPRRAALFWEAITGFSPRELSELLAFATGCGRLRPTGGPSLVVNAAEGFGDGHLPVAHTCAGSLDLPDYSTPAVCAERLRFAMAHCTTIDADFVPHADAALPTISLPSTAAASPARAWRLRPLLRPAQAESDSEAVTAAERGSEAGEDLSAFQGGLTESESEPESESSDGSDGEEEEETEEEEDYEEEADEEESTLCDCPTCQARRLAEDMGEELSDEDSGWVEDD